MVKADKREKIIVVSSEPLTFEKGVFRLWIGATHMRLVLTDLYRHSAADWMEIPTNTLVCITPKMNVLQQPIKDEYYVAQQQAHLRSPTFAVAKGFPPNSATIPTFSQSSGVNGVAGAPLGGLPPARSTSMPATDLEEGGRRSSSASTGVADSSRSQSLARGRSDMRDFLGNANPVTPSSLLAVPETA